MWRPAASATFLAIGCGRLGRFLTVSASRWGPCIHGGCCAVARRVGGSAGGCDGVDHAGLVDWQWQVGGQRLGILASTAMFTTATVVVATRARPIETM